MKYRNTALLIAMAATSTTTANASTGIQNENHGFDERVASPVVFRSLVSALRYFRGVDPFISFSDDTLACGHVDSILCAVIKRDFGGMGFRQIHYEAGRDGLSEPSISRGGMAGKLPMGSRGPSDMDVLEKRPCPLRDSRFHDL